MAGGWEVLLRRLRGGSATWRSDWRCMVGCSVIDGWQIRLVSDVVEGAITGIRSVDRKK